MRNPVDLGEMPGTPAIRTFLRTLHRLPTEMSTAQQDAMRKELHKFRGSKATMLGGGRNFGLTGSKPTLLGG